MCVEVEFAETVANPWFHFNMRNEAGVAVFAATSMAFLHDSGTYHAGERAVARIAFENLFTKDRYRMTTSVSPPMRHDVFDRAENAATVVLTGAPEIGGIVSYPYTVSVERA